MAIWIVLPILTLLMFDLGLSLKFEDFGKVFRSPWPIVVALLGLITVFYIQHHRTILESIGALGLCVTALILVAIAIASSPFIFANEEICFRIC